MIYIAKKDTLFRCIPFSLLKNEKGFEALGPKGFGYLYYTSNRNLASKPAAKIHLFFE